MSNNPKWHTEPLKTIEQLKTGDTVQHKVDGNAYQVRVEGGRVFAVREIEITNPPEWLRVIIDNDTR